MNRWKIIDEKKAKLDKLRPLPPHTLKSLQETITLEWTYHSNAIEGNTLTYSHEEAKNTRSKNLFTIFVL